MLKSMRNLCELCEYGADSIVYCIEIMENGPNSM